MKFEPIHVPHLREDLPDKIKKMGRKLQEKIGQLEGDRNSLIEDDNRLRDTSPEEIGPRLKTDLDDIGTRHLELLQRELALRKEIAEFFRTDVKKALQDLVNPSSAAVDQIREEVNQLLIQAGYVNVDEPKMKMIIAWSPRIREAQRNFDEVQSANWSVNEIEIRHQGEIQATKDKLDEFASNFRRAISIPA